MRTMDKKTWRLPITLGLVAMVMGFLICGVYMLTKDRIAARAAEAQQQARRSVLPAAVSLAELPLGENAPVDSCFAGYDVAGGPVGYVSQITVIGFGGEIEVTVGMDMSGAITAVGVGGASFSETSGFGAKTKEPGFTDQFAGKSGLLVLKENIDSVTGASISSGAVVGGVNAALSYMTALLPVDASAPAEELPLTAEELAALLPGETVRFMGSAGGIDGWWRGDTGYIVQATGYGRGPIVVKMAFRDGVCVGIVIGDENFTESEGYGAKLREPAYWQQFLYKSSPQSYGSGVDAISGATASSNGALAAINACMSFDPDAAQAPEPASAETSGETSAEAGAETAAAAAQTPASGEATAEAAVYATPAPAPDAMSAASAAAPTATPVPTPDAASAASAAVPTATPVPTPDAMSAASAAAPTATPMQTPDAASAASAAGGN